MPRLFTALEIPHELALRLSLVRGGLYGAKWIDADNYHITLRFFGDVDARTADEIAHSLDDIRRGGFQLTTEILDVFGGNKPRALFAKVNRAEPLRELQSDHERIAQRAGLRPEGRKFLPHVTLARLKQTRPDEIADFLSQRGGLGSQTFDVKRFVLMSSKASVGGGPYIVEEAYDLAA